MILKQLKDRTKPPQALTGLMRKRIRIPHSVTLSSMGVIIIPLCVCVCSCSSPQMPPQPPYTHPVHTHF